MLLLVLVHLGALHPCPHATVTWSPREVAHNNIYIRKWPLFYTLGTKPLINFYFMYLIVIQAILANCPKTMSYYLIPYVLSHHNPMIMYLDASTQMVMANKQLYLEIWKSTVGIPQRWSLIA